jgi:hypothetical protein
MRAVLDSISEEYRYLYKLNLNSTGSYKVVEGVTDCELGKSYDSSFLVRKTPPALGITLQRPVLDQFYVFPTFLRSPLPTHSTQRGASVESLASTIGRVSVPPSTGTFALPGCRSGIRRRGAKQGRADHTGLGFQVVWQGIALGKAPRECWARTLNFLLPTAHRRKCRARSSCLPTIAEFSVIRQLDNPRDTALLIPSIGGR